MKAITQASRINSAIQVMQHMNSGMTVVDACKAVGIPCSTYYYIINANPEVMVEFQEMVQANARVQLGMILASNNEILEKVIDDALSDETAARDRLAIYKALNELGQRISNITQKVTEIEAAAHEFLMRGAKTSPQKSRLTATREMLKLESEG